LARAGDELHNPVTRQRIRFVRPAADTGGEVLEVEASWEPGGHPAPTHYHPAQDERFEVLSGKIRCVIDGEERILHTGEVVEMAGSGGRPVPP
jgi:quercetin dioxygenase-like cupin family protein